MDVAPNPAPASAEANALDESSTHARVLLWLLLALFFATSLAVLPLLSLHRGDERYYTDAAIRMVKTGDWITPYYADGTMRFRKPILAYWIVAAPFKLLGVGVAASRIGSLVAMTITLALSYRLGLILTRDRRAAIVAVAVLASNENVLAMAARATTDALQTFAATLSLVGLAGVSFTAERKRTHAAIFWLGVGLLAATKGGLAVVMLLFAVGFLLRRGRRLSARLRDLLHLPAMLAALVIGFGWFVAVLVKHGHVAWDDFWSDQVGTRLEASALTPLKNLAVYIASLPLEFLPWSLLLVIAAVGQWRRVREYLAANWEAALFTIAWLVLLLAVFSPANIQRTRYFLPAYPLLAVIGSGLLLALWDDRAASARARMAIALIVVGSALMGMAELAGGWRFDPLISIGGGTMAVLAIVACVLPWPWRSDRPGWQHAVALGVFVMLLIRVNDGLTSRPLTPPAGPMLAHAIADNAQPDDRIAAVGVAPGQLAQVRLLTGGVREVDRLADDASESEIAQYDVVLLGHSHGRSPHVPDGFNVMPLERVPASWRIGDVIAVGLAKKRLDDLTGKRSIDYAIAVRDAETRRAASPETMPVRTNDRSADED